MVASSRCGPFLPLQFLGQPHELTRPLTGQLGDGLLPALWGPVGNLRRFAIKAYFEELLSKA